MKMLFTTNFPSHYRVAFFNELGKHCDLTVAYERSKAQHRDSKWLGGEAVNFRERMLNLRPFRRSQSNGFGIVKEIRRERYDDIVFSGYASPSVIYAVMYCRLKKIPYYFEYDGGFYEKDSAPVAFLKKRLLLPAKGHFITCRGLADYLHAIGVADKAICRYPFSSVTASQLADAPSDAKERAALKAALGITEPKAVLAVGQFIARKGFDVLLRAAASLDDDTGIYLIGGKPTEEYLKIIEDSRRNRVHFIEFVAHEELSDWYRACDVFVLPTRYDIWGLVINEAMAHGIPVVSTTKCCAALELIDDGESGFLAEPDNAPLLAEKIRQVLADDAGAYRMGVNGLAVMKDYTIENMALAHIRFMEKQKPAESP